MSNGDNRINALEKRADEAEGRIQKLEIDSVKYDLRTEVICLRRDIEALRAATQNRSAANTQLITDYRAEVVRLGAAASDIAVETKRDLSNEMRELGDAMDRRTSKLFSKIDDLFAMLGAKGHS